MTNYFTFLFPNIEKLSQKDSSLSTKRYADLRLINHVIWQSWAVLLFFMYEGLEHEITIHAIFLFVLCFFRGLLAKTNITGIIDGRRSNNGDDK